MDLTSGNSWVVNCNSWWGCQIQVSRGCEHPPSLPNSWGVRGTGSCRAQRSLNSHCSGGSPKAVAVRAQRLHAGQGGLPKPGGPWRSRLPWVSLPFTMCLSPPNQDSGSFWALCGGTSHVPCLLGSALLWKPVSLSGSLSAVFLTSLGFWLVLSCFTTGPEHLKVEVMATVPVHRKAVMCLRQGMRFGEKPPLQKPVPISSHSPSAPPASPCSGGLTALDLSRRWGPARVVRCVWLLSLDMFSRFTHDVPYQYFPPFCLFISSSCFCLFAFVVGFVFYIYPLTVFKCD